MKKDIMHSMRRPYLVLVSLFLITSVACTAPGAKNPSPVNSNLPKTPAKVSPPPTKASSPSDQIAIDIWNGIGTDSLAGYPQDLSNYESGTALQIGQATQYQNALNRITANVLGEAKKASSFTDPNDPNIFISDLEIAGSSGGQPILTVFRRKDEKSPWKLDFYSAIHPNVLPLNQITAPPVSVNKTYTAPPSSLTSPKFNVSASILHEANPTVLVATPEAVRKAYAGFISGVPSNIVAGDFVGPYTDSSRSANQDMAKLNGNLTVQTVGNAEPYLSTFSASDGGGITFFLATETSTLTPVSGQKCLTEPAFAADPLMDKTPHISTLLAPGKYSQVQVIKSDMIIAKIPSKATGGQAAVVGFEGHITAANGSPC